MEVQKKILNAWAKEFRHLNKTQVAAEIGISRTAINNALIGKCTQRTVDKINEYIIERKKKIKTLCSQD